MVRVKKKFSKLKSKQIWPKEAIFNPFLPPLLDRIYPLNIFGGS
jgi:hypothetical protein